MVLDRDGGEGDGERQAEDDGGMAERKVEADADRLLALMHELAGDVVDGGDVVGVDGVAQAEAIGEKRGPQQNRVAVKTGEGPGPCRYIGGDEQDIESYDPAFQVCGARKKS